jgi:hypothetical protein
MMIELSKDQLELIILCMKSVGTQLQFFEDEKFKYLLEKLENLKKSCEYAE